MVVEEETDLPKAPLYTSKDGALKFTYDPSLDRGDGVFRYVYDQGAIRCSGTSRYAPICRMSPNQMTTIAKERNSFIFLDVGVWGHTERYREYSFGLVSGPNVYLCELVPSGTCSYERHEHPGSLGRPEPPFTKPNFRNESVRTLFEELERNGCTVKVILYARAPDPTEQTLNDTHLYLFLPDFHLPSHGLIRAQQSRRPLHRSTQTLRTGYRNAVLLSATHICIAAGTDCTPMPDDDAFTKQTSGRTLEPS